MQRLAPSVCTTSRDQNGNEQADMHYDPQLSPLELESCIEHMCAAKGTKYNYSFGSAQESHDHYNNAKG
eukprot:2708007-Amphidinium_carterae.1